MCVAGDLGRPVAALVGPRDGGEEPVDEAVAQGSDPVGPGRALGDRGRQPRHEPGDPGDVLGTGAAVALLAAPVEDRLQVDALAHEQGAHALRTPELVPGDGDEVGAGGVSGDVAPGGALDGVDQDGGARCERTGEADDLGDGLDRPDLVVDGHDGDDGDGCVGGQQLGEGADVKDAGRGDGCLDVTGAAAAGQPGGGVAHGVVLDGRGDDRRHDARPRAGPAVGRQPGLDDPGEPQVERLRAAPGEDDLPTGAAEEGADLVPGVVDGRPGGPGGGVNT